MTKMHSQAMQFALLMFVLCSYCCVARDAKLQSSATARDTSFATDPTTAAVTIPDTVSDNQREGKFSTFHFSKFAYKCFN